MEETFGRTPKTQRLIINITPLVDVMLLLLIFFMVTTTFRDIQALDMLLPEAGSGDDYPYSVYEIVVEQDGQLLYNGVRLAYSALGEILGEEIARDETAQFAVRADKRVSYEYVVRVLDIARVKGIEQLILPVAPLEQ